MLQSQIEEAITAVNEIASGCSVRKGTLQTIYELLDFALHAAAVGSCSERVRAIERLSESQFWIEKGFEKR